MRKKSVRRRRHERSTLWRDSYMEKFEEFKIKVVMKAEHVTRDRAIQLIAERSAVKSDNEPVKSETVGSSSCDLLDDNIMTAEEFFSL